MDLVGTGKFSITSDIVVESLYVYPMPGVDVPDTDSEMYFATPYAWDTRAIIQTQSDDARSTVVCSSAFNATTDAGVLEKAD